MTTGGLEGAPAGLPGAASAGRLGPSVPWFVAGLGACLLSWAAVWGIGHLSGGRWSSVVVPLRLVALLAPAGAAVVLAALRLRGRPEVRWLAFLSGAALPYLFFSCSFFGTRATEYLGRRGFDAAAWKAAAARHTDERLALVDDLLDSDRLRGLDRTQVLDLLGPDDSSTGTGFGAGYFAEWDLVYWLGPERGWMSIDSEWMVVRFDPNGRVAEARLVRD